jgi:3-oxoacyl-[acyl-carrier protein] reductase
MASDRYIDFANSDIGRRLVGAVGLPAPVRLERWQAGRLRPVEGACCSVAALWPSRSAALPRA